MSRARTALLTIAAFAVASATGCSADDPSGCQSGATSPTAAVTALLKAASAGDAAAACAVMVEVSDAILTENLTGITAHLDSVGGLDAVTLTDVPDAQVGALYLVDVVGAGTTEPAHFTVERSGERYLVLPPYGDLSTDEDTTDPNPRPSESAG